MGQTHAESTRPNRKTDNRLTTPKIKHGEHQSTRTKTHTCNTSTSACLSAHNVFMGVINGTELLFERVLALGSTQAESTLPNREAYDRKTPPKIKHHDHQETHTQTLTHTLMPNLSILALPFCSQCFFMGVLTCCFWSLFERMFALGRSHAEGTLPNRGTDNRLIPPKIKHCERQANKDGTT